MGKMDETEKRKKEEMLAHSIRLSRESKRIMRLEVQVIDLKEALEELHCRLESLENAAGGKMIDEESNETGSDSRMRALLAHYPEGG